MSTPETLSLSGRLWAERERLFQVEVLLRTISERLLPDIECEGEELSDAIFMAKTANELVNRTTGAIEAMVTLVEHPTQAQEGQP